ncbi:hypothetical protein HUU39_22680, partial [candidate division KSB1 bacterium]|nr:hypothetical protein [candidate division KSB1 bacterium]
IDNQTVLAMLFERNLAELAENLLPEFTKKEAWEVTEIESLVARHLENGTATLPLAAREGAALVSVDMTKVLEEAASEIESQLVQAAVSDLQHAPPTTTAPAPAGIVIREKADWYPAGTEPITVSQAVAPAEVTVPVPQQPEAAAEAAPANKLKIRFDTEEPLVHRAKIEQQPAGPFPPISNSSTGWNPCKPGRKPKRCSTPSWACATSIPIPRKPCS